MHAVSRALSATGIVLYILHILLFNEMKPKYKKVLKRVCDQCGAPSNTDELAAALIQSSAITQIDFDLISHQSTQIRKSMVSVFNYI